MKIMTSKGPGLYDFLIEAELQQYYAGFKNDLKVQNASQLKYVSDDDLHQIGMSKPEMRRLKKFFQKHFPQNYLSKFKKMILPKKEEQWETMLAMLPDETIEKPPIRVPNKHIIPADAILVNKELGTGEFGVVQQGVWTNDGDRIQVAIKCLSRERMQSNPIEFLKEAAIMHGIDHEHIVRLYGVVLDTNALMLVTELAPLRSLLECLKEPSLRSSFPVLSLCDFAIQICDGMQYLETKRLIHRDLAARNILVFSKNKVKISDFGLSRALGVGKDYYQTNFNVNLKLPIAWCAPECISYLRFTSASDVWAYGVTLWEMFSYGFQPWAALTGHQILEAIDEPNFQRLEQPDCCPKEYYSLMLKCWQHDPNKRPRFADLLTLLPECKPEQVQAVQELSEERVKREQLLYRVGEVITVLDKSPVVGIANCWKGVVNSGKTGLFNPAHTVAYLGSNLPSNKPGEFTRGDGKNVYSSRRNRLRPDMISCPQGDLKHTGHVGLDGAYFGDISFLGGTKYERIPHQIVAPYKPQDDSGAEAESLKNCSDRAPLLNAGTQVSDTYGSWAGEKCANKILNTNHEYHEISDEENGADSPKFEKTFDLGPSLLDEMDAVLKNLGGPPPPPPLPPAASPTRPPSSPPPPPSPLDDAINKRNELREIATTKSKKKQATVKPISAADERTLDCAIALANELAARSMNDLGIGTDRPPSAPISPASPNKRKFSFRFPTATTAGSSTGKQHHRPEGKTFTDEAASIPDIQSCCSSLQSLSSCTSIESLHGLAPFRLPLWDRASAEFCFARSRDLLTRIPLRLDSSIECLESSEADDTLSLPSCNTGGGMYQYSENEKFGVSWNSEQIVKSSYTVATNQPVSLYANGECKLSVSPDSESTLSQQSDDDRTASSLTNISSSVERSVGKLLETRNDDNSLSELQPLSEIIRKYPMSMKGTNEYSPSNIFDSDFLFPKKSEGPNYANLSRCTQNNQKQEKTAGFNIKKLGKHLHHIPCRVDEKEHCMFNNNYGHATKGEWRQDADRKSKNLQDAEYERLSSKEKCVLPPTPVFKRKLTQLKTGEKLENKTVRSSPNSPGISFQKPKFRPRTNSLTEERMYSSVMLNRRQSLNFEKHHDSSSSESDYDSSRAKGSLKCMNNFNNLQYNQTMSSSSSASLPSSEDLVSYQSKTKF